MPEGRLCASDDKDPLTVENTGEKDMKESMEAMDASIAM